MVGIELQGMQEIATVAAKAVAILTKWNEKATMQNLIDLTNEAKKIVVYKRGELRDSINHTVPSTSKGVTTGQYGSDLPYAKIIELGGTIPAHVVNPRARNMLAWYDPSSQFAAQGGKYRGWVFAKASHIPAQHRSPKPYLFPVLVIGFDRCLARYSTAYQQAMKEAGAKE